MFIDKNSFMIQDSAAKNLKREIYSNTKLTFKWILLVLTSLWLQLIFLPDEDWEGYAIHKGRRPTLRQNVLEHALFSHSFKGNWGKYLRRLCLFVLNAG